MKERLDRIVSRRGLLSRKDASAAIRAGRVRCGGEISRDPAAKFDPDVCEITLDGARVSNTPFVYIMMNKPCGVLSATEDKKDKTALDLLPPELARRPLGVCGRLDRDASGLLLLTDDGELNHKITSPKSLKPKLYEAALDKEPPENARALFERGLDLGDFTALPARLDAHGKTCFVTVCEGKFHQVKRMFRAVGCTVLELKRLKIGSLSLDPALAPGEYRVLTDAEREELLNSFR
ncbi:MAG: rRNA pseudouridine synthase [Clostridia bacterium]|nr:rRNA pseudouridine synthase [Clostridia bacterium]